MLYEFHGGTDGETPRAGLVADVIGNLYGTTYGGGDPSCDDGPGCGTVFKLDPNGNEPILHSFTGTPDGEAPIAGLIMDGDGNLYGTTVFKLDRHGKETLLHSFADTDGAGPYSTLVQDAAGNLYGTTSTGGDLNCDSGYGCGVVFKITP